MEVLSFEVRGRTAHFRKPWANSSALSYGGPPPTTVFGIIGAAAGWPPHEVSERTEGLEVAIEPLAAVRRESFTVNMLHDDARKLQRGARTQVPVELLRCPEPGGSLAYAAHVIDGKGSRLEDLQRALEAPTWPISLGPAYCLAAVKAVRLRQGAELESDMAGPVHGMVNVKDTMERTNMPTGSVEPMVLRMSAARHPTTTGHVLIPEQPEPTLMRLKRGIRVDSRAYGLL